MIDMKMTPAQKSDYEAVPMVSDAPEYPYGLSIDLSKESLERLGKSASDFELGEEFEMTVKVKVKGISSSQYEGDSDGHESVDLQICEMEMDDGHKSDESRINRLYGEDDG